MIITLLMMLMMLMMLINKNPQKVINFQKPHEHEYYMRYPLHLEIKDTLKIIKCLFRGFSSTKLKHPNIFEAYYFWAMITE